MIFIAHDEKYGEHDGNLFFSKYFTFIVKSELLGVHTNIDYSLFVYIICPNLPFSLKLSYGCTVSILLERLS